MEGNVSQFSSSNLSLSLPLSSSLFLAIYYSLIYYAGVRTKSLLFPVLTLGSAARPSCVGVFFFMVADVSVR